MIAAAWIATSFVPVGRIAGKSGKLILKGGKAAKRVVKASKGARRVSKIVKRLSKGAKKLKPKWFKKAGKKVEKKAARKVPKRAAPRPSVRKKNPGKSKTKISNKAKKNRTKNGLNTPKKVKKSDPRRGRPNSVEDIYRDGKLKTRRYFGNDGRATHDVDMTDHGNTKNHPFVPHKHKWKYKKDGTPVRGKWEK